MTTAQTRPRQRADAARNRAAIINTARTVYGERGLDAPLDDIAKAAGVGSATLYRHFPARCDLVAAVFVATLERVIAVSGEALAEPDPWAGFCRHVRHLCRMQAEDRGLADLLITPVEAVPELEQLREQAYNNLVAIADRAKAAGALRKDFAPQDLSLLLMANAGLVQRADAMARAGSQRFVDLTLDGMRAAAASPASPAPSRQAVRRALRKRAQALGFDDSVRS